MRALVSADRTVEGLRLEVVPEPVPGPTEALVRVTHSSLNRGDALQLGGRTGRPGLGWDVAGTVLRAAADGSGPRPGDRVVGLVGGGAWAELAAVHTGRLAVVPDGAELPVVAALPLAGLTALRALERGGPVTGRRVLVTGATGGVGSLAVQIAVAGGALVTALQARNTGRRPPAPALPTGVCVVHSLGSATDAYDVVVDAVGGDVLAAALRRLAPRGRAVSFGAAGPARPAPLPADFLPRGSSLHGFMIFDEPDYDSLSHDLTRVLALHAAGRLVPHIDRTGTWDRTAELLRDLLERRVAGKVVISIG